MRYFLAVFEARGEPERLELASPGAGTGAFRTRRSRGWDGELPATSSTTVTLRRSAGGTPVAAVIKQERSPELGVDSGSEFSWPTTIEDVAYATNLRKEDVAYALVESGLASWRRKRRGGSEEEGGEDQLEGELAELIVTPELLEEVYRQRRVKPATVMELAHCLITEI